MGDVEAPLLAVVPSNTANSACPSVTERTFRKPMYVKVRSVEVHNIRVELYNGAGQLIPFHPEAVTTIRLQKK